MSAIPQPVLDPASDTGRWTGVVRPYKPADVERLLADVGIVRNRRKIDATITNARRIADAVPEGLYALLWSFAPPPRPRRPIPPSGPTVRTRPSKTVLRPN